MISEYQKSTIETLQRMKTTTKGHTATCACHTCIYMRDIENRPDIRRILQSKIN